MDDDDVDCEVVNEITALKDLLLQKSQEKLELALTRRTLKWNLINSSSSISVCSSWLVCGVDVIAQVPETFRYQSIEGAVTLHSDLAENHT